MSIHNTHEQKLEDSYHRMNDDMECGLMCLANLEAILKEYGCKNVEELNRAVYNTTESGCSVSVRLHDWTWHHSGDLHGISNDNVRALRIGSIVEGSEAEVHGDVIDLLYYDDEQECFQAFCDQAYSVNALACELWDEANKQ